MPQKITAAINAQGQLVISGDGVTFELVSTVDPPPVDPPPVDPRRVSFPSHSRLVDRSGEANRPLGQVQRVLHGARERRGIRRQRGRSRLGALHRVERRLCSRNG